MASVQTSKRIDSDFMRELRVSETEHRPSWRIIGAGYAELRVNSHRAADWTQLAMAEGYINNGRLNERKTYMTLNKEAAIALRDLLNEQYPVGETK